MTRSLPAFLLTASLVLLTACSSMTPYKPMGKKGGYSEFYLRDNEAIVTFSGNNQTPRYIVDEYMLRRSAEITLEKGYRYFYVMDETSDVYNEKIRTVSQIKKHKTMDKSNSDEFSTTVPSNEKELKRYEVVSTIKLLQTDEDYPDAVDAEIVMSNFKKGNAITRHFKKS